MSYNIQAVDDNKNVQKNGLVASNSDIQIKLNGAGPNNEATEIQNGTATIIQNGDLTHQQNVDVKNVQNETYIKPQKEENERCETPQSSSASSVSTVLESDFPDEEDDPNVTADDIEDPKVTDLDVVTPAESLWTCVGTEAVKLRMTETGVGTDKPRTVPSLLLETVRKAPGRVALAKKVDGQWKKWTYRDYYLDVRKAAKGFIKLGLEPYHGVGILGFNSPEWFISDIAAIHAGGWAVGIYTTNTPEACQFVAENCEANIIVVENTDQLKKILQVRESLPHLKAVVQWSGEIQEEIPGFLYTWEKFMELSAEVPDSDLDARLENLSANKCCTLIYTSGTTGNPKGVMLSHDNFTWTARHGTENAKLTFGTEVLVSYLPLSHVAAQLLDIHIPIAYGGSVYFAQPDALKGSLGATLKEVHPTSFLGVPRVWEKIMERMVSLGRQTTGIKKKIALWAKGVGLRGSYSKLSGGKTPFGWTLANFLVFKKVKKALGLDRCKFNMTGAAPITKETLDYFLSLNIPISEVYGMSESTGPHTTNVPGATRITSCGQEFNGAQTKIHEPDEDGNGEICMYGRHVFMGYLNAEDKTTETLDEEGYLHTGDIGRKDKDGYLFITGRIKELIITAGGENIPPVAIEDQIRAALPCVSNCMLIGDKRKFLSVLITLKTEVDADTTEPLDQLADQAKWWCEAQGSDATTLSEILEKKPEAIYKAIEDGIKKANKKAVSRAQTVQKFSILPRDFSLPGGELGPSLKLRRPIVNKMYSEVIDGFYVET